MHNNIQQIMCQNINDNSKSLHKSILDALACGLFNVYTMKRYTVPLILFLYMMISTLAISADYDYLDKSDPTATTVSLETLDDYLEYAAINNPSLKSSYFKWQASLKRIGYVGSLPDPVLTYSYFIENVETRVGPQNHRFSLRQSFPWFGTLGAKKDVATKQANVANKHFQAMKFKLFYLVKSAYYKYYYLGREIEITSENLELLKFWEAVVRTRYKVALSEHPDIIKAQVELGILEDRLLTLQEQKKPIRAELISVMNLSDDITLNIPEKIEINEVQLNSDSIRSLIIDNNPNLQAMIEFIEKEQATIRLASKSSLPSFSIGADFIETGDAIDPNLSGSGKDPWIVGIGISLPIWFGKNKAVKEEAKANYQSAQYAYLNSKNRLESATKKIIFEYSDALRKLRLYRDGLIPKSQQSLNANYSAYQSGESDFLALLDSQRQLLSFQLKFERALSDLAIHRAEIEMLIGDEIDK